MLYRFFIAKDQSGSNSKRIRNTLTGILTINFVFAFAALFLTSTKAQFQDFDFSGNSADSYQCFDQEGTELNVSIIQDDATGYFFCDVDGDGNWDNLVGSSSFERQAVLKPPKLQQAEIWFIKILYVVWALVAGLSFFYLVALGYQYMISRGDVTKITYIRQRIINYGVGFALVFLAVPILSTVFRLMGINQAVACYRVDMPAFQFFFADLCTDPIGAQCGDLLSRPQGITDLACPTNGETKICTDASGATRVEYRCNGNIWEFNRVVGSGT